MNPLIHLSYLCIEHKIRVNFIRMHVAVWNAQHVGQLRLFVSQCIVLVTLSKSNDCSMWGHFHDFTYVPCTLTLFSCHTLLIVSNEGCDAHFLSLCS